MRAILALVAITGNIGRPGAGWVYANLQSHVFDAVRDPVASFPPAAPDGVARVAVSMARLGPDMLALADPPLRVAWVERGNPIPQNPETPTVLAAFRALDFRVVVDQFLTDTAREADLVLPAKTMFEQSDVIGAYWHADLQLKQKVIEPPGEVKPESEIYRLLAAPARHARGGGRDGVPGERRRGGRVSRAGARAVSRRHARAAARGAGRGAGRRGRGVRGPRVPDAVGEDRARVARGRRRAGAWPPSPDYVEPIESVRRPAPDPAAYPLYLLTPNTKNRIHSQFGNLRMIRQFDDRPRVAIHPDDARARGIRDGARVRVFNARGAIEIEARLDNGLKAGLRRGDQRLVADRRGGGQRAVGRARDRHGPRRGVPREPRAGRGGHGWPRSVTWAAGHRSKTCATPVDDKRRLRLRREQVHGLRRLPGGLHDRERPGARRQLAPRRDVQPAPPPARAALPPVARVQPLRRRGVHARVPGAGVRARAGHRRPCSSTRRQVHRLRLLRLGLPVRRAGRSTSRPA